MPYGPSTNRHIVKLASGEVFSSAAAWSPDDFTLPFAERLKFGVLKPKHYLCTHIN